MADFTAFHSPPLRELKMELNDLFADYKTLETERKIITDRMRDQKLKIESAFFDSLNVPESFIYRGEKLKPISASWYYGTLFYVKCQKFKKNGTLAQRWTNISSNQMKEILNVGN